MKTLDNQMHKFKSIYLTLFIIFIGGISIYCSNDKHESTNYNNISNECYSSDTIIIKTFIKQAIKNSQRRFVKNRFFKDTLNLLYETFNVDTIIYAPDGTKFFSIVITKSSIELFNKFERENEWPYKSDYFYGSRALLGYRKSNNEKWKIRLFEIYTADIYPTYQAVKNETRNAFFNNLSEKYFNKRDSLKNRELIKINTNVLEKGFWKSVVWDSVTFKPSYFPFELNNLGEPWPTLNVTYPDSLICSD